jgi:hypothetical protein
MLNRRAFASRALAAALGTALYRGVVVQAAAATDRYGQGRRSASRWLIHGQERLIVHEPGARHGQMPSTRMTSLPDARPLPLLRSTARIVCLEDPPPIGRGTRSGDYAQWWFHRGAVIHPGSDAMGVNGSLVHPALALIFSGTAPDSPHEDACLPGVWGVAPALWVHGPESRAALVMGQVAGIDRIPGQGITATVTSVRTGRRPTALARSRTDLSRLADMATQLFGPRPGDALIVPVGAMHDMDLARTATGTRGDSPDDPAIPLHVHAQGLQAVSATLRCSWGPANSAGTTDMRMAISA